LKENAEVERLEGLVARRKELLKDIKVFLARSGPE
jgi:hypothetical protein